MSEERTVYQQTFGLKLNQTKYYHCELFDIQIRCAGEQEKLLSFAIVRGERSECLPSVAFVIFVNCLMSVALSDENVLRHRQVTAHQTEVLLVAG